MIKEFQKGNNGISLIECRNVSYYRDGNVILDKISFTIDSDSNYIILGPNGSGKTTLLKMITGYIRPSSGILKVLGERIGHTDVFKLRLNIAWISTSLEDLIHFEDPVIDIVIAGNRAVTRVWEPPQRYEINRALELLDILGIKSLANMPYGIISQGERKKVLIARALMRKPKLLVLDEPCEGLDIKAREEFLRMLDTLRKTGESPGILMVTHRIEEITPLFNRIIMMKDGKVIYNGEVEKALNDTVLSGLFGVPVKIISHGGRYFHYIA